MIRNVANGRLWDVGGDDVEDGIEILLWPEKDKSLVESGFTFCGAHEPTLTKY